MLAQLWMISGLAMQGQTPASPEGVEGVLEVVAKKLGAGNVWNSFLFVLMGGRIPHHGIPLPRPLEFSV